MKMARMRRKVKCVPAGVRFTQLIHVKNLIFDATTIAAFLDAGVVIMIMIVAIIRMSLIAQISSTEIAPSLSFLVLMGCVFINQNFVMELLIALTPLMRCIAIRRAKQGPSSNVKVPGIVFHHLGAVMVS